jgi:hypothetical protein
MSTGTSQDSKPIQAGDRVTAKAIVFSVALPNVVLAFDTTLPATAEAAAAATSIQVTVLSSDLFGAFASGAGKRPTPIAGERVSIQGLCSAVSGSGSYATLSLQLNRSLPAGLASNPQDSLVTISNIPASCCFATQSL